MRSLLGGLVSLAIVGSLAGALSDAFARSPQAIAAGVAPTSCVPAHLNVSAALVGSRVTVSPEPDSRDASAATQISMLGVPAGELSVLSVKGSRSGVHAGELLAYSQGDGGSFLPSHPFLPGERVSIHALLREGGQSTPFAWSFIVATPDKGGVAGGSPPALKAPQSYQSFHSRPGLKPPTVTVTAHAPQASPGDIFLAPYSGPGEYGPMILDESGQLLWFKALSPQGARAADFRVQSYEGEPVLTWWQDPLVSGGRSTAGEVIANSAYQDIAIVRAGNGYQPDLHEFQITPQNTAFITVYDGIDCDLSSVGGPRDAAVADTLLQEIDLKTGLVMFEWHSLDHVALGESYVTAANASLVTPFDYFHINAIDLMADGDLLVDSRNTWTAYEVDPRTGIVGWRLGGKHSSFAMGPGTRTAFQHDARQQPDGTFTFFDNGATPKKHPESRAIQVSLNLQQMTATLVRVDEHAPPLVAGSQGNLQALAGGDWMVGWGQAPDLTEYAPSGEVLFDAHLPSSYESYRVFRMPWSGQPQSPPAIAVVPPAGGSTAATLVYVSWNGATGVASWRLLAGSSPSTLQPLSTVGKGGFETALALPSSPGADYVEVQALDAAGDVMGASAPARA